jgi:hypothetical protein
MRGIRVTSMTDEEKKKIASIMANQHMEEFIKRLSDAIATITSDTIHADATYVINIGITINIKGEKLIDMIERVKGVYISFD